MIVQCMQANLDTLTVYSCPPKFNVSYISTD